MGFQADSDMECQYLTELKYKIEFLSLDYPESYTLLIVLRLFNLCGGDVCTSTVNPQFVTYIFGEQFDS